MENFAQLLEEYSAVQEMNQGEVITAEVVAITDKHVIVNAGLKSESLIDLNEFKNAQGELEVKVGDFVTVTIESVENGFGETKLSREKAKRAADWLALEEAMESGEILSGVINGKVKGGLTVMINSIRAFLPGSLVDVRPVKDTSHFEGKEVEFKVIKLDRKRNNVVVSRRAVLEETLGEERQALLETLQEGTVVKGIVKNITDYGAFVDLGGIDGLVHLSDLSWSESGEEAVRKYKKGEDVEAVVLSIDVEKERISLGIKQLEGDPFGSYISINDKGALVKGTVKSVEAKGAEVQLADEVVAYLPASEFDSERVEDLTTKLKEGDEVEAVIVTVDRKNRNIKLSVKARTAKENREALNTVNAAASHAGTTSLGDLLKAKLGGENE